MTEVNIEKGNDIANVILKNTLVNNKYYDSSCAVTGYQNVRYCRYQHPLGIEIRRTGFGFEDRPKDYGEKEVGYRQSGASYTYNGTLRGKHRGDYKSSFMGGKQWSH